ncbi:ATP binding [Branchiostoma belcheri]|nr:ATP binding [Branchiostoma belcheri]
MDDSYFANNHIQYFPRPAYGHDKSWAGQWNPERRSMSMNRSPPFSTGRSYQIKKKYEAREEIVPDGRTGMVFHSRQYLMAKGWLESYAKRFGDAMQRECPPPAMCHKSRHYQLDTQGGASPSAPPQTPGCGGWSSITVSVPSSSVLKSSDRTMSMATPGKEHLAALEGTPTSPEDQAFKTRVNSCVNKKAKTTRYHKKHSYHP